MMSKCSGCGEWVEFKTINGRPVPLGCKCTPTPKRAYLSKPSLSAFKYEDTCRPSKCPRCFAEVYFVRHNGGSVYLDELGWPWPKHGCFDQPARLTGFTFIASEGERPNGSRYFGHVIRRWAKGGRDTAERLIAVVRSDKTGHCFRMRPDCGLRDGDLVLWRRIGSRLALEDAKGKKHFVLDENIPTAAFGLTDAFLSSGRPTDDRT